MVTKTYKAESALETLQLVQAELGANAIVVSMREIPNGPAWNPWKSSAVEIVAASPESPVSQSPAVERQPQAPAQIKTSPSPVMRPSENKIGVEFIEEMPEIEWADDSEQRLAELRAQPPARLKLNLNSAKNTPLLTPSVEAPSKPATTAAEEKYVPAALKKIQQQLLQQGVDEKLVNGLVNVALETLSPATLADFESCKKSIVQFLSAELPILPGSGNYVMSNVVCVIGASGSGKTSAIAKLALFYSQRLKKTITWVCADTVRSGAVAEARAYADALGLNQKLVYVPQDLKNVVGEAQPDDLFLVDTPGYNPCSENQMVELGSLLAEIPKRCTYLVVPATTKEADLFQLTASLGIFNLNGVIVTKLDETHSFGSAYNFARRNQIPLGYFSTGRDAFNHFDAADPTRLVLALFGKEWMR
jgi:flagellar biosynthesis protein FlhF